DYSITSSAVASSDGSIMRPSVLAVLTLMPRSNFATLTTGSLISFRSSFGSRFRVRECDLFFLDDYCRVLSIFSAGARKEGLQEIQQPQSEPTNPPLANILSEEFVID